MATRGDVEALIDKTLGVVLALERENERLSWRLLRSRGARADHQTEGGIRQCLLEPEGAPLAMNHTKFDPDYVFSHHAASRAASQPPRRLGREHAAPRAAPP